MTKRTINLLWTGGLDSTCRVAELSLHDVIVQPYYIIDKKRSSTKYELRAISRITDMVRRKDTTKCDLRDVIIVDIESIPPMEDISAASLKLSKKYHIGTQYEWLARFARQKGLTMELGLQKSPRGKSYNAIIGESTLIEDNSDGIIQLRIDKEKSSKEISLVFGDMLFPMPMFDMEKPEEVAEMRKMGLDDLIPETWFCHRPVFGLPCGYCSPCDDALNEDMAYRVPMSGRVLGAIRRITYDPFRKIIKKAQHK